MGKEGVVHCKFQTGVFLLTQWVLMFQAERARLQRFVLWARFVQLPLDVARNVGGLASLTEHLKALDSETRVVLEHAS